MLPRERGHSVIQANFLIGPTADRISTSGIATIPKYPFVVGGIDHHTIEQANNEIPKLVHDLYLE